MLTLIFSHLFSVESGVKAKEESRGRENRSVSISTFPIPRRRDPRGAEPTEGLLSRPSRPTLTLGYTATILMDDVE